MRKERSHPFTIYSCECTNDVASRKTDGYSVKPRPMLECSLRSLVCLWNVVGFDVSERDEARTPDGRPQISPFCFSSPFPDLIALLPNHFFFKRPKYFFHVRRL